MGIAHQGDIIKVEKIKPPVLVVSKDFFNESGEIIGCPIIGDSNEGHFTYGHQQKKLRDMFSVKK